ncbi:MAG TPA: methyl-accepting chemotaxis protein [Acetobacteraceae bacterium]
MDNDLDRLRNVVSRVVLMLIWLQAPIASVTAYAAGNDWLQPGLVSLGLASITTLVWWRSPTSQSSRLLIAVALIASLSLIVAASAGSAWQVDLHMCYFAELAMLAAYCDRDVVLAGAGTTATHHLALNFLMPALVFPGGAQLERVLLHASVLCIETAALVWLTYRIATLLVSTAANLAAAVRASDAARVAEAQAAELRSLNEQARQKVEAELAAAAETQSAMVGAVGAGLACLAKGDLVFRLQDPFAAEYEELRENFNAALEQMQELVRGIVGNADAIRSGTEEIRTASDDLSRRTEQQAASLEETAAAMAEITATVRKTAESSKQVQAVVSRTKEGAEQSGEIVRQAVTAMGGIEQSSQKIGDIIGVIDEIAFQTNLLALNAGVEAARAGDAGRGFAVVASEVRALAQRSAEAAKEIKALISTSALQVGAGVKLVGETGRALSRIVSEVGEVTTAVSEIAALAQGQAAGLGEVNTAINQMDQVTQQNAAMVEQSTAAIHSLARETAELVRLTEHFQIGAAPSGIAMDTSVQPLHRPAKPAARMAKATALRVVSRNGRAALAKPSLIPASAEEGWTEF